MNRDYGERTEAKISEVLNACEAYGESSIIALSGVPGTGKSFIANIVAQRLASDPLMVREIQFHPTFSYEEFIEGYRANSSGGFSVEPGAFLEWNDLALEDESHCYVLQIEELTRANLPSVMGELMTYIEHRGRLFHSPYSRRPIEVAKNLRVIATYNPRDRSALELDEAMIRRLRVIACPPDMGQLREMLLGTELSEPAITKIEGLFRECQVEHGEQYERLMPFGHGMFADVTKESPDMYELWHHRLEPLLCPPARQPHPFYDTIKTNYPWRDGRDYAAH